MAGPAGLTAADLAGLGPEEIATIVSGGQGTARIGQMAIGEVLGIPERDARINLMQAQTGLAKKQATALVDAQTAFQQKVALTMLQKAKTPEEINLIKAQTSALQQSGQLDAARAAEIMLLLDEKEQAEKLGNQKRIAELNSYISILLPKAGGGTEAVSIQAKDLIPLLSAQAKAGGLTPSERLSQQKFLAQQEQTAVEIDKIIRENPKSSEALARYEDYNRYSNRSQIAINDGGKVKFVKLGKFNGRTVTAQQIFLSAMELGVTVDELYAAAKDAGTDVVSFLYSIAQQRQKVGGQ